MRYEDLFNSIRAKIQKAEAELVHLEERQSSLDEPDSEIEQRIDDQREYLAGLHSGLNQLLQREPLQFVPIT